MQTNKKTSIYTHEGAKAKRINAYAELRRSVLSCLLWEKQFYEDGESIADRIKSLCAEVDPIDIAQLAIEARTKYHLRHIPLLLTACLANQWSQSGLGVEPIYKEAFYYSGKYFYKTETMVQDTIDRVIMRADELSEFLAIYAHVIQKNPNNIKPFISAQVKKGLAKAFTKFSAYQLAKYNRDKDIKLRDVMFLCHPKPLNDEQAETFRKLANNELESPDTWEVSLSSGKGKKETFERLINEGKLGYMALLRNLRNMQQANVDIDLVSKAILTRKGAERVLPFRYIAAARAAPLFERELDMSLINSMKELPVLSGLTLVLVDVSGSMSDQLSSKSDLTRLDAASGVASVIKSDKLRIFSFSESIIELPPRSGMSLIDAIKHSQPNGGTYLGQAVRELNKIAHNRLIVITDEQSNDTVPDPVATHAYMINVCSFKNGVGYGKWVHIDGFSENVIRYIYEYENNLQKGD